MKEADKVKIQALCPLLLLEELKLKINQGKQACWPSGKYESKPQWDTTSHPLGWPVIKNIITSVGEKSELLYFTGGM